MTSFAIEKPLHTTLPLKTERINTPLHIIHKMMDEAAVAQGWDLPHHSEVPGEYAKLLKRHIYRRTYVKDGKWLKVVVTNFETRWNNNN